MANDPYITAARDRSRTVQHPGGHEATTPTEKLDPLSEAKDLLENVMDIKSPPDDLKAWPSPDPLALATALAQVSIAESLNVISNDLASLCDMLTDLLQQREAERNRRDLEIG